MLSLAENGPWGKCLRDSGRKRSNYLRRKKKSMARTGMCVQRSGVWRKQKVINRMKWKTAANYNTDTNRESWMSGKGEGKIIFFKAVSHWLKCTLNVSWLNCHMSQSTDFLPKLLHRVILNNKYDFFIFTCCKDVPQNSKFPMDTDNRGGEGMSGGEGGGNGAKRTHM